MNNKRIIAVHLLNDFSGSPLVFREAISAYAAKGYEVILYTASPSGKGFLSHLPGVENRSLPYRWYSNKWLTLFSFLLVQGLLFFRLLFTCRKDDIVYINTLLPFGAALAAACRGARVWYHVHEISLKPALLKKFLLLVAEYSARRVIFVSGYLSGQFSFKRPASEVIYNKLPAIFEKRARTFLQQYTLRAERPFSILMLCSLKEYKGVYEFVYCARQLPRYRFMLVLNAGADEVERFRKQSKAPSNCEIYAAQHDTHQFYQQADLVVNFSLPHLWVETFGMTVLEAHAYHLPVIVPPVGGPAELLQLGVKGICCDARNREDLLKALRQMETFCTGRNLIPQGGTMQEEIA